MTKRLIHELRAKFPRLAKSADKSSRKAAIRLFCLECMGGSPSDVRACDSKDCPLHNYRMGGGKAKD